ncbi:MAG: transcription-repair coupling factor [Planctomycetota bacterium]
MTLETPQRAAARPSSAALARLTHWLQGTADFKSIVTALTARQRVTVEGIWGSSTALVAAALAELAPGPVIAVCAQVADVEELAGDIAHFTNHRCLRFPAAEVELVEQTATDETLGERLRVLKTLAGAATAHSQSTTTAPIVATSIQSLLQPVPLPQALLNSTRRLQLGQQLDIDELLRWLVENRFQPTTAVAMPGEFSHRGGILDLFAPDWESPVRVELFDDQVESIRSFDVATQRSLGQLPALEITIFRPQESGRGQLADYLPANSWWLWIEPRQIHDAAQHYLSLLEAPAGYHALADIQRAAGRCGIAQVVNLAEAADDVTCRLGIGSIERFSGDFQRVREEFQRVVGENSVTLLARTAAEIQRLRDIFAETTVVRAGRVNFVEGDLRAGFALPAAQEIVLTGAELFRREELKRTPRRHLGKAIDSFLDLNDGDLVVHLSHGIGRYRGLKLIEKQGHAMEHLEIEFDEGTKMYVPAARIELVQKYVGGSKSRPKLAKIGGQTWSRQKKATQAAVADMAVELLEVQAARRSRAGIEFSPDSDWQRAFDSSFPYQETPDQLAAIEAIKGDMERNRPMDRLLCGDVGYGKTEVAMRAAFKAVDNGYQVAVLVPTTILAEQHYQSFRRRMAEFPFKIARLSRFCPADEERTILEGLSAGSVDIVIGTHRLASQDVQFHNLGLVIIDEEQRFGVEVKERLKALKTTVDVLTLSATPIPRTLHMSLVGVRDIVNLETPPEERVAVETKVTRYQPELIRHAILRELNRGGQIYFVHNRVGDMEEVTNKLRMLVPEARMRVGHGQMNEHELEQVMLDFVAHRFDILVATTIVESGLDIPNANTIFIDEADRYGLADLHQLRGRVGRYKHHAYCYLLIDPAKYVTPNAARRLHAIEEFSNMGAGFAISMRDLEIRGAGNLLGSQQSGHIAAVGYELYCQMLEAAVRDLKKLPTRLDIDVDIHLPGKAYLPDDYIPDLRQKIDLYRRISRIQSVQEVSLLQAELNDRFGPLPAPAKRQLELAQLKLDATVWQVSAIRVEGKYLVFAYRDRRRMEQLARLRQGKLRVVDDRHAYLTVPLQLADPQGYLALAKSVLRPN